MAVLLATPRPTFKHPKLGEQRLTLSAPCWSSEGATPPFELVRNAKDARVLVPAHKLLVPAALLVDHHFRAELVSSSSLSDAASLDFAIPSIDQL